MKTAIVIPHLKHDISHYLCQEGYVFSCVIWFVAGL